MGAGNRALKAMKNLFTKTSPMIAVSGSLKDLSFPIYGTPKIRGIRMLTVLHEGRVVPVTRGGEVVKNKELLAFFENIPAGFDGEFSIGEIPRTGFIDAGGHAKATAFAFSENATDNWTYTVFDTFLCPALPYKSRLRAIEGLFNDKIIPAIEYRIRITDASLLYHENEAVGYYEALIKRGFEGAVFRNPRGEYIFGNSNLTDCGMVKVKP